MWAMALVKMAGGMPVIDQAVTPYHGHLLIGKAGDWGAYMISGKPAELTALNALPEVVGICTMTESGSGYSVVKWAELSKPITAAMRTKLNTYLTSKGLPTVPSSWSNRQVVETVFKRLNPDFRFDDFWVKDQ